MKQIKMIEKKKRNHPIYQNINGFISIRNKEKGEEWVQALTKVQEKALEAASDLYDSAIKMPRAYMEIVKLIDEYQFYQKIEAKGGIEKFSKDSLYYNEYKLSAFIKDQKYKQQYDGYFQADVSSVVSEVLVFIEKAVKNEIRLLEEKPVEHRPKQSLKWKDDEEKTDQESESTEQKLKRPLPDPQQPTKSILKKPKVSGLGD